MGKPSIFVVMGMTGEYSDKVQWPVCYFDLHDEAENFAFECEKYAKSIQPLYENQYESPEAMAAYNAALKAGPDKEMDMNYTGARYWVLTVPHG